MNHRPEQKIENAFILAAGMGARLKPYTDHVPKPMVEAGGKALINHALDKLVLAGVKHVTVNTHYMAATLEEHLKQRDMPEINISREEELLDTGGGVKKALENMQGKPFFLISGDALWDDGAIPALTRLAQVWDDSAMDLLLLLQPVSQMTLTGGVGDYSIDKAGKPVRSLDKTGTHMFTSIRICHPRLFEDAPEGKFSFLDLMDKAQRQGRLAVLEHDSAWHHISTPEDLERVNAHYSDKKEYA